MLVVRIIYGREPLFCWVPSPAKIGAARHVEFINVFDPSQQPAMLPSIIYSLHRVKRRISYGCTLNRFRSNSGNGPVPISWFNAFFRRFHWEHQQSFGSEYFRIVTTDCCNAFSDVRHVEVPMWNNVFLQTGIKVSGLSVLNLMVRYPNAPNDEFRPVSEQYRLSGQFGSTLRYFVGFADKNVLFLPNLYVGPVSLHSLPHLIDRTTDQVSMVSQNEELKKKHRKLKTAYYHQPKRKLSEAPPYILIGVGAIALVISGGLVYQRALSLGLILILLGFFVLLSDLGAVAFVDWRYFWTTGWRLCNSDRRER